MSCYPKLLRSACYMAADNGVILTFDDFDHITNVIEEQYSAEELKGCEEELSKLSNDDIELICIGEDIGEGYRRVFSDEQKEIEISVNLDEVLTTIFNSI